MIGAIAAPNAWTVNGWASLSLIIISALYSKTLYKGISELYARMSRGARAAS